jgi:methylenetetrahydrofolate dehydrogenase (NADP+)/methenyltetrahydrofolate cyclohydrolase
MSLRLEGAPVASQISANLKKRVKDLAKQGVYPKIAMINVGQRKDNVAYCNAAQRRFQTLDILYECVQLPETVKQSELVERIGDLNHNPAVHGILVFRPLPDTICEEAVCDAIVPEKDVDGVDLTSMAGVYSGRDLGFAPCTADAVLRLLKFYRIGIDGKKITVIGRSPVIGRPVASLLLREHATVTVCHSHTEDLKGACQQADIVIAAAGRAEFLKREYFRSEQTVIDIGINYSEEKKKIVGDVDFEDVETLVTAITPVPAGVGSITTSVLADHVVTAAEQMQRSGTC